MSTILHCIKAYLYKNMFPENPNEFTARSTTERSLDVKAICESAVEEGKCYSAGYATCCRTVFKRNGIPVMRWIFVNTGSFTAFPSIKGVFHSPSESFNPGKHTLSFRFNQGDSLHKRLTMAEVNIIGIAKRSICIEQVIDLKSGSINDRITSQHNIRINGRRIKLVGNHPEVGIYFINRETGERIKAEESDIIINYPSVLIIITPASLTPGAYLLEISSQYSTGCTLQQPHTATFERELTVE